MIRCSWSMDFVKSPFEKLQLWIVEQFHLHKKLPAVMNHNMIFFKCYDSLLQVPFCEEKTVQLFRVAFFRRDFFRNPYFSNTISFCKHKSESIPAFSQSFSCATAEGVIRYADCDLLDTSLGDLNNPLITCVKMALSFPPFLPLCDQPLCSSPQWGQNIFRLALIRIQKLR